MMKALLLTLIVLISLTLNGQITIDDSDFFQTEDSVGISISDDLNIDFTTTGANSNWDFSNLTASEQLFETARSLTSGGIIINLQFGPFAPSEYQSSYFQKFDGLPIDEITSFLPIQVNSVNRMVKLNSNELTYPGFSLEAEGQSIGFQSDTIEIGYEFPLNFGDSYSSVGYTDINFSPLYEARIKMHRQRTSTVDGYGQLTTPHGTYDVLRIHHSIEELDSIYIEFGPIQQWIPFPRITSEYEWWAKNKKRPVLKIETETLFGAETPSRISYLNNQVAQLEKNELETKVYPNPSNGIINIESLVLINTIKVFSTDGRMVYQKATSGTNSTINLSHLTPGMYTIQAISPKGQSFNPIIIK
ncbi:T9SS type A sorting domain-containing protein [Brumimicrobium mesophilum]|uniref:T9SS type A sorting domain-containing protein n=1 Tax=Brumimicrobium mesophilum TaxID=392717 RepID=UPI000D141AA7|nr:T9SS type A sorting domain-containing protein [Brumimicrobium mesophilum]